MIGRRLGIGTFNIAEVFVKFEKPAPEACNVTIGGAGRLVDADL